ncbi:MAG: PAS domain S-box protein [Gammaproteobacteria bacterium]|nr:PAS domain S-box protein [Gammaproteobacteria bacterium]
MNSGDQADIRFVQSELLKIRETVHAVLMSTYHAWSNTLTTNQDKIRGLRYLLYASFAGILLSSFGSIRVLARQVRFGRDLLAENNLALDEVKSQKLVLEQEMEQRQQAVAALRDSENRFKDVADIAADWFWELDEQLRFSYLSERYQEITGVDPSKVIGRGPKDFPNWQEQNAGTFERQVDSMNNRQAINDVEMSFTAGDGSERKISISGRPLFANDGRFLGYRGVGRDITGRVKVEQELMAQKLPRRRPTPRNHVFLPRRVTNYVSRYKHCVC